MSSTFVEAILHAVAKAWSYLAILWRGLPPIN